MPSKARKVNWSAPTGCAEPATAVWPRPSCKITLPGPPAISSAGCGDSRGNSSKIWLAGRCRRPAPEEGPAPPSLESWLSPSPTHPLPGTGLRAEHAPISFLGGYYHQTTFKSFEGKKVLLKNPLH